MLNNNETSVGNGTDNNISNHTGFGIANTSYASSQRRRQLTEMTTATAIRTLVIDFNSIQNS